jgi:AbrB family looped-hinge helix DNA binding protein
MLIEGSPKAQITLPKPIVDTIGLAVGDLLDISERDGGIFLLPVIVTPKKQATVSPPTQENRRAVLRALCGSIDDPTMTEPPDVTYESPREEII